MTAVKERLPIAVRAHAVRAPGSGRSTRKPAASASRMTARPPRIPNQKDAPSELLAFDTETTTDSTQTLKFGSWRYYRARKCGGWDCVQEVLFYGDDLQAADPAGMAVLRRYAATTWAATDRGPKRRIELLSRGQFVEKVLYASAWKGRARVVGFNLPFDLSRIAIDCEEGRRTNRGGFSFILAAGNAAKGYKENKYRPPRPGQAPGLAPGPDRFRHRHGFHSRLAWRLRGPAHPHLRPHRPRAQPGQPLRRVQCARQGRPRPARSHHPRLYRLLPPRRCRNRSARPGRRQ
jgi:hypothetical protein